MLADVAQELEVGGPDQPPIQPPQQLCFDCLDLSLCDIKGVGGQLAYPIQLQGFGVFELGSHENARQSHIIDVLDGLATRTCILVEVHDGELEGVFLERELET